MTPRERWLAILAGKATDRVPVDMTATPEVIARLLKELNCADREGVVAETECGRARRGGAEVETAAPSG